MTHESHHDVRPHPAANQRGAERVAKSVRMQPSVADGLLGRPEQVVDGMGAAGLRVNLVLRLAAHHPQAWTDVAGRRA